MFRRTIRTQLTLLYAVPFLISGVALLTIPVLQVRDSVPANLPGVSPPNPPVERDLGPLLNASALGLAVMVMVSLVLGWLIAGRFLRPLRTITATARDISASNLHRRLGLTGRDDEFRDLAETLDDLFERLEASFRSQRHFVANASHELRTPLTAERALLQVALADQHATVDSLRATCQDVLALGEAQERLIESLLTLASGEQGIEQPVSFDLGRVTRAVVLVRQDEAHRLGVHVDTALEPAPASGDPSLVESLVANLVENALRHNIAGGRVAVTTGTTSGRAHITVENTGAVIPPDQLERLLQPFERLGRRRIRHTDGHGIGLAIVRAIVDAHGATVVPRARPEGGLHIEVTFPESPTGST